MQYDPKLKKAMQEIEQVLLKHDIVGFIAIGNAPYVEYKNHLKATWSCAFVEHDGIRFRARLKEDYQGDVTKRNDAMDKTFNVLHNLAIVTGNNALHLMDLQDNLSKVLDATSGPMHHTGETTQNN